MFSYQFFYINVFLPIGIVILEGPSDFIVIPPATKAVFSCNLSEGALPAWTINGVFFARNNPYPTGHVLDGNNLNVTIPDDGVIVNLPANGSEYVCMLTFLNGSALASDPAFLYIAGMYICTA